MRRFACLALVLGACDAYEYDLGPTPFFCGPSAPRCPNGYTCEEDPSNGNEVCVDDRGLPAFVCTDDSALEPNSTLAEATMTQLDSVKSYMRDLAICPATDKDVFALMITTASERIEMLVVRQPPMAALEGGVVNAGGVPIASLAQVIGMDGTLRAITQPLSIGTYYVEVAGPAASERLVNYKLTINVIGP